MHNLTDVNIEKRAVMELILFIEEQLDMIVLESKKVLDKRNQFCLIQGIRKKQRIDRECIREAIKTISYNSNSCLSERTGGNKKERENLKENTEVV
jgi:hypothetical protein